MNANSMLPATLLWVVLPLWLLAGLGDYLCPRRTRIEETSGTPESKLHVVQFVQIAVPTLMGLFLKINFPVLAFMALCWVGHTATALWDTAYASRHRRLSPLEQHIHSYLELLPLFALILVFALHWNEVVTPDFRLAAKSAPLAGGYIVVVVGALCFAAIPILEEWWRTSRRHPSATPRFMAGPKVS